MSNDHLWAVIMAGGSGTRFWPQSRGLTPKQLSRIVGDTTMIQATVARLQPLIPAERVLVVTTQKLAEGTRRQLPALKPEHIIAEPFGRDTAPCVGLAAEVVKRIDPEATMILLPADQVIEPVDVFQKPSPRVLRQQPRVHWLPTVFSHALRRRDTVTSSLAHQPGRLAVRKLMRSISSSRSPIRQRQRATWQMAATAGIQVFLRGVWTQY